ncbi:MAG: NUDIX hydrolase [Bacteroidetes bacterium]|nr:NUDIX hydrolase [Rhodothermia bacterium]MCS7154640.1 NUDIX hydrolase [Bacteroidota bacterium]MCX7906357.1 NUDIX hydrolase [Bacteroidota bacterium]MDW8137433.1 NUDIX hydrolase [Bacteroidota bacterium]MDW8285613.1 NUDIX hydrolase [Bacteroidota bacterium]
MPRALEEVRLESLPLVEGVLIKAYRDTVRLPNGRTAIREWIRHPGAAIAVPLFPDGSTLLVRQFRYAVGKTFVEVPAGKLDHPEANPEETARRELQEETGYRAQRLTFIARFYPCIGYSNEVMYLYLAEELTQEPAPKEEDELLEPLRLPWPEAMAMVYRNEIEDMKSMLALLLIDRYLHRRRLEDTPS